MSKCMPILDQMPPEILEKIVGYTGNIDKFQLRQCCKYFKQIVDDSEIVLQQLEFDWNYSENQANVLVEITDRHHIDKTFNDENPGKPVENAMAALKFVEKVLKRHPKIRVGELKLEGDWTLELENSEHRAIVMEEFSRVFSGLENKLQVETLQIISMPDEQLLMTVLPHLAPGTLHELHLSNTITLDISIDLLRTVETEQWKQAEVLTTVNYLPIDLEKTDHFKHLEYRVVRLEVEDVKRIVENILRKNGWKQRNIHPDECDFDAIEQFLLQFDNVIVEDRYDVEGRCDDKQITIRRDGYGCRIEMLRWFSTLVFERIVDAVVVVENSK